jgi:D-alanyl-D-alanine carboxypeptidase
MASKRPESCGPRQGTGVALKSGSVPTLVGNDTKMRHPLLTLGIATLLIACGGGSDPASPGGGGSGATTSEGGSAEGGGGGGGGGGVIVEEDPFEPPPEPAPLDQDSLDTIASSIDAILAGFAGQTHSVMVVGADSGQVVYTRDAEQLLKPASNTKLFTTAAAFARLGEEHRHQTRVFATAAPSGGVIDGDLVLFGDHDFSWSTQFYPGSRWPLDRIAETLAAMGITQVTGSVQVRFEHLYNGQQFSTYNAANHRAAVASNFNSALNSAGIATAGTSTSPDSEPPAAATELTRWVSLPLHVGGSPINRISHNEFADILSRHVGWELEATSSYAAGGDQMVALLAEAGSDVTGLVFFDGSGLSHDNRVSARQLIDLYDLMRERPEGLAWERTFAVAGIKGTIGGRMGGPDTIGRFRGKTGTLNAVIALSGVLDHRHDGQRYHLAMLMNGVTNNSAARSAHDQIVGTIAADHRNLGSRPESPELTQVVNDGNGQSVTVSFDEVQGASGYLVWRSPDGRAWPRSEARLVEGLSHRTLGFEGFGRLFVRVSAIGQAGESDPSNVYGARVGDPSGLVLVDGNDRWRVQPAPENPTAQGHDFLVPYADVLDEAMLGATGFDSCNHRAVVDGDCGLDGYTTVIWALGEESTEDVTLDASEQAAISGYLAAGGSLLISGAELGWNLGNQGSAADAMFFSDVLHAAYAGDDAGTFHVDNVGQLDHDGPVAFLTPDRMLVSYPDQLATTADSEVFLSYFGGAGGVAAVRSTASEHVIVAGFPLESIAARDDRAAIVAAMLEAL